MRIESDDLVVGMYGGRGSLVAAYGPVDPSYQPDRIVRRFIARGRLLRCAWSVPLMLALGCWRSTCLVVEVDVQCRMCLTLFQRAPGSLMRNAGAPLRTC